MRKLALLFLFCIVCHNARQIPDEYLSYLNHPDNDIEGFYPSSSMLISTRSIPPFENTQREARDVLERFKALMDVYNLTPVETYDHLMKIRFQLFLIKNNFLKNWYLNKNPDPFPQPEKRTPSYKSSMNPHGKSNHE